jgi:hypothetical protein
MADLKEDASPAVIETLKDHGVHLGDGQPEAVRTGDVGAPSRADAVRRPSTVPLAVRLDDQSAATDPTRRNSRQEIRSRGARGPASQPSVAEPHGAQLYLFAARSHRIPQFIADNPPLGHRRPLPFVLRSWPLLHGALGVPLLGLVPHVHPL